MASGGVGGCFFFAVFADAYVPAHTCTIYAYSAPIYVYILVINLGFSRQTQKDTLWCLGPFTLYVYNARTHTHIPIYILTSYIYIYLYAPMRSCTPFVLVSSSILMRSCTRLRQYTRIIHIVVVYNIIGLLYDVCPNFTVRVTLLLCGVIDVCFSNEGIDLHERIAYNTRTHIYTHRFSETSSKRYL